MKLTTKGRYAVMAMSDLASYNEKRPISLTEISLRQNISLSYLEQLFLKLKDKTLLMGEELHLKMVVLIKVEEIL